MVAQLYQLVPNLVTLALPEDPHRGVEIGHSWIQPQESSMQLMDIKGMIYVLAMQYIFIIACMNAFCTYTHYDVINRAISFLSTDPMFVE